MTRICCWTKPFSRVRESSDRAFNFHPQGTAIPLVTFIPECLYSLSVTPNNP